MIALNFSWIVLWKIRFTDTALSFTIVKGLVLHLLCYTVVYPNVILFWTFKLKRLGLLVWPPYDLLAILILCMCFCNLFNVSLRQTAAEQ